MPFHSHWIGMARRVCLQQIHVVDLGGTASAGCQLTNVIQEDGTLQSIQLRGIGCNLGQKRIGHQNGRFVTVPGVGIAEKGGDVHLQGPRQPVERRERRHRLTIFDLGDVGARHVHASRKLALGEVSYVSQISNCSGDLNAVRAGRGLGNNGQWGWGWLGFFDLERFVAAAAQRICCAELDQAAVVAAQDLSLLDGCHHGCHKLS
jgi:hypothetical protein